MFGWLRRIGLCLGIAVGLALIWRGLLLLVAFIAAGVLPVVAYDRWHKSQAVARFRKVWGTQGKDLLLVYSDSPHWRGYVEDTWLSRWGRRAVVLNWSERSTWGKHPPTAEVDLFRAFAGEREFNPLAIVVPPSGKVRVVRFWRAFRGQKHGKPELLKAAEAELQGHLADKCGA